MSPEKLSRSEIISRFRTREIIEAAIKLVRDEGIDRLTMERLASAAGVAKGTVYLYFKDKDQLLMSVMSQVMQNVNEEIEEAVEWDGTIREKMFRVLDVLNESSRRYSDFFKMSHHQAQALTHAANSDAARDLCDRYTHALEIMSRMFARSMERGEIVEADSRLLGLIFLKSSHAMLMKQIYELREDEYADAKFLVEMFLNGISLNKD
ncbi:MAG TPA: TetR/AcrR family transcriptional regulator [Acidobacteriota bacterium]|nr:TetR/AcrR family transcriptional regulator [Acidobacteriota bacterium]